MRRALPHLSALVLGVAAALVVGCGDRSHLIPADSASSLKQDLANVRSAVDSGDCGAAAAAMLHLKADALRLPPNVDHRLRSRVNQGIRSLAANAPKDCLAAKTQTTTVQTTTTPTTTTAPQTVTTAPQTTTTTTPTETQPPTQTTTTPTVTTPSQSQSQTTPSDGTGGATIDGGTG